MATPEACLDLLSMLSMADNRRFDEGIAIGWSEFLRDLPDEVLIPAGRDAVRNEARYITPQVIAQYAGPYVRKIARDVRSARIRGWLPPEWPDSGPLPDTIRARLTAEFYATNTPNGQLEAWNDGNPDLGTIGRDLD